MLRRILPRLLALRSLAAPLGLTFVGVVALSLAVAYLFVQLYRELEGVPPIFYFLTLQFIPRLLRAALLGSIGLICLVAGIYQLGGVALIRLNARTPETGEIVLGFQRERRPKIVVLSGGAGMLVLSGLSDYCERLTCIVPVQDHVEYYYRASSMFQATNIYYVVPTAKPAQVVVELDNGLRGDIKGIDLREELAGGYAVALMLDQPAPEVPRVVLETIAEADAILLGPGSLFESILPNLLIPALREAVQQSKARKIYIANLMTEPGLTTNFSVGDHIRAIRRYGGFSPDYTLVNAQRIESEIYQIYAAAHQSPVFLSPEELEETAVLSGDQIARKSLIVEESRIIEADLSSAVVQYSASLENPTESRAVRVLRHDSQKLLDLLIELLHRT